MSKKRIAGIAVGGVLAAALAAGGIGVIAYALTPDTHPYVSVTQSHEISAGAIEDTQLAAQTSREATAWTAAQELAAQKAAEAAAAKAAADAVAAQQAAAAAAAAQAADQAAAQQESDQTETDTQSDDNSAPAGITCPAGTVPTGYSSPGVVTSCGAGDACQEYSSPGVCVRWLPGYKP